MLSPTNLWSIHLTACDVVKRKACQVMTIFILPLWVWHFFPYGIGMHENSYGLSLVIGLKYDTMASTFVQKLEAPSISSPSWKSGHNMLQLTSNSKSWPWEFAPWSAVAQHFDSSLYSLTQRSLHKNSLKNESHFKDFPICTGVPTNCFWSLSKWKITDELHHTW